MVGCVPIPFIDFDMGYRNSLITNVKIKNKSSINYIPVQDKDLITTYPVKYVIVSDPSFQPALQPLIDWKTKKGFNVIEAYTNDPLVCKYTGYF